LEFTDAVRPYDVAPVEAVQVNVAPVDVMLPADKPVGAGGMVTNVVGLGTAQLLVPLAFVAFISQ
jgi:hypothetical protein